MLILNKKSISSQEHQLFQAELEKFRPHQNRLLQLTHKQTALMKELTKTYGDLLQDKRVRSEQARYENYTRQRNLVLTRYKKIFQAFKDLIAGLMRAQSFYSEMRDTVESLEKNVETFVNNRRAEGAQLLSQIERGKVAAAGGQADRERDRLRELMERMSMDPSSNSPIKAASHSGPLSRPSQAEDSYSLTAPPLSPPYISKQTRANSDTPSLHAQSNTSPYMSNPHYQPSPHGNHVSGHHQFPGRERHPYGGGLLTSDAYNPMAYPFQPPATLPPAQGGMQLNPAQTGYNEHPQHSQYLPHGYIPPPPPPGPPPTSQPNFGNANGPYPAGVGGYAHHQTSSQGNGNVHQGQNDPWAGLSAWK